MSCNSKLVFVDLDSTASMTPDNAEEGMTLERCGTSARTASVQGWLWSKDLSPHPQTNPTRALPPKKLYSRLLLFRLASPLAFCSWHIDGTANHIYLAQPPPFYWPQTCIDIISRNLKANASIHAWQCRDFDPLHSNQWWTLQEVPNSTYVLIESNQVGAPAPICLRGGYPGAESVQVRLP